MSSVLSIPVFVFWSVVLIHNSPSSSSRSVLPLWVTWKFALGNASKFLDFQIFFFCVCFSRAQCFHCWDDKGERAGLWLYNFWIFALSRLCGHCSRDPAKLNTHDSVSILRATTERPEQVCFLLQQPPWPPWNPKEVLCLWSLAFFYAPKIFRHPWNCVVRGDVMKFQLFDEFHPNAATHELFGRSLAEVLEQRLSGKWGFIKTPSFQSHLRRR